jgi:F0F1-type ATP synthase assembly protein I
MTGMNSTPKEPEFSKYGKSPSGAGLAGVGVEFLALILVGMFAGQWIDRRFAVGPWGLVAGVFIGAAIAFSHLLRVVSPAAKREGDSSAGKPG